jgi:hypothetical protein
MAGCCKLATAGETDTNKGARCVLLWLQVYAVVMGLLFCWNPEKWLNWPCDKLNDIGLFGGDVGVCECYGTDDQNTCYSNQLIYRCEASAVLVFILLEIMCVSGCARHAAKDCPFGKFLILTVLIVVLLFVPNTWLTVFGQIAGVASAIYLLAQTVLFMDFAYCWNENWFDKAVKAERSGDLAGKMTWQRLIVAGAAAVFIFAVVELILLFCKFHGGKAVSLIAITFVVGIVWLVISITDWCDHGNLLTSTVVLAYLMWLCYEALSMLPVESGGTDHLLPRWIGILVCALSLALFASASSMGLEKATTDAAPAGPALAEQGQAGVAVGEQARDVTHDDDVPEDLNLKDFSVQCAVHACAAVYITSALAPSRSDWTFTARVVCVVLSCILYGWTLVAPKVLKNREF